MSVNALQHSLTPCKNDENTMVFPALRYHGSATLINDYSCRESKYPLYVSTVQKAVLLLNTPSTRAYYVDIAKCKINTMLYLPDQTLC